MTNIIRLHQKEPYENGLKYGGEMGGHISTISRLNVDSVLNLICRRGNPNHSLKVMQDYLKTCIPITEKHLPDLVEETMGIAKGAGKSFEDIFLLNAFLDMFDFTFPKVKDELFAGGCTCFGIRNIKTGVGYIAQNYDVRNLFAPGLAILDIKSSEGLRSLVVTIAGMVGCVGFNEVGLGVVINNLTPIDSRPGVPHNYVVRHILSQENIGDAINALASLPRASGYNYILGDGNGEIIGLETTATSYNVYLPENGTILCHSNHYITDALRKAEGTPEFNGDSIVRYSRARNLLYQLNNSEIVLLDGLKKIMRDHVNYPHSICRHTVHNGGDRKEYQGETVFSVVLDLKRLEMHYCQGNPCSNNYRLIKLEGDE